MQDASHDGGGSGEEEAKRDDVSPPCDDTTLPPRNDAPHSSVLHHGRPAGGGGGSQALVTPVFHEMPPATTGGRIWPDAASTARKRAAAWRLAETFLKHRPWLAACTTHESPAIAVRRLSLVRELEDWLCAACLSNGVDSPPSGIMTRWMFTAKMAEKTPLDSLIPCTDCADSGMVEELRLLNMSPGKSEEIALGLAAKACALVRILHENSIQDAHTDAAPVTADTSDTTDTTADATATNNDNDNVAAARLQHVVQTRFRKNVVQISFGTTRFKLTLRHYERLNRCFRPTVQCFDDALFCMLCRYETLSRRQVSAVFPNGMPGPRGPAGNGEGYQAAVPESCFDCLERLLGVQHEAFSSPLNCFFRNFSSAFADVDMAFGSFGSFFELREQYPHGGSFEANPPFIEELMLAMALYIESWLSASIAALSFVVFVPGWHDESSAQIVLSRSNHCRAVVDFGKKSHSYRPGFDHRPGKIGPVSYTRTCVLIVQNDAGARKWEVDEHFLGEFSEVFNQRAY